MAYKPEAPPDKGNFIEPRVFAGGPSLPKSTGYNGYNGYQSSAVEQMIDGRTVAVLIDSTILGALLWFSFDPAFDPMDGVPVFYADEIALLKNKPASTLRKIYEAKKTFGPGMRARQ